MIVKRKKNFSDMTSSELQAEQMKMQRQVLEMQRQREKLRAEETKRRLQATQDAQRQERMKDEEEAKNQIKVRKIEQDENRPSNTALYKSRSKIVTPIPMRG